MAGVTVRGGAEGAWGCVVWVLQRDRKGRVLVGHAGGRTSSEGHSARLLGRWGSPEQGPCSATRPAPADCKGLWEAGGEPSPFPVSSGAPTALEGAPPLSSSEGRLACCGPQETTESEHLQAPLRWGRGRGRGGRLQSPGSPSSEGPGSRARVWPQRHRQSRSVNPVTSLFFITSRQPPSTWSKTCSLAVTYGPTGSGPSRDPSWY